MAMKLITKIWIPGILLKWNDEWSNPVHGISSNKTGSDWYGNSDKTFHSGSMKIAMWTSKICSEYRQISV